MGKQNVPRVAVYCRLALKDKLEMEEQVNHLTEYALSLGYRNLTYYVDNGSSGNTFDRPGFQQMEADIKAGKIDVLLVRDISRIGRGMIDTSGWIDSLIASGRVFVTADMPYEQFPHRALIEEICRAYTHKCTGRNSQLSAKRK